MSSTVSETTDPAAAVDAFLYDEERLSAIASDDAIKAGLGYFKENRVYDLERNRDQLWAVVEGLDSNFPFSVVLKASGAGSLSANCACADTAAICKHVVATLYAYAEQQSDLESVGDAAQTAIRERSQRGKTEVRVRQLTGALGFGVWEAKSIRSSTHWQRSYRVQIRSLGERVNYCNCPDLASNQLGTCKHIEAVLHQIAKDPDYQKARDQGAPSPFVYLAWGATAQPRVRLHRPPNMDAALEQLVDRVFDAAGDFCGQWPDDLFRFADAIDGHPGILLGEDALNFARRAVEQAAYAIRAQKISQQIDQYRGALPGIRARLYPYQVEGVAFLASRGRAMLADDMGLGKTLQAIAAAVWLADNAQVKKILIVCPASLKHQWAREIERFTGEKARVIQGPADKRGVQYRGSRRFVIVNYELTFRDLSVINEILRPDLLILDEAQRIKNWQTKTASTVKLIASRYAFVLTGTPLENRLEDLYSLLQVVDSQVLGPLWRYLIDFHVTDERGKVIGYRNLSELRQRIAPVMLRRDRRLVKEQLPDRTELRLDVPMTQIQQELHDAGMAGAGRLAQIAKTRPLTPSEQNRLIAGLQQARMACDAAGLVDGETVGSPKLTELASLLDDLCLQEGRKVVVFSQWERMTQMVETVTRELNIGFVRLHGGVPTARRGDLLDSFRNDASIQVFISTDAGGVGLNLQAASALINLDMPWNPAVLEQRIARIHRLGQKRKVQIILMLAADSYEQQVAQLAKDKRDLFDQVIDEDASEDVVGVPKKLLATLIEDLGASHPDAEAAPARSEIPTPSSDETAPRVDQQSAADLDQDLIVKTCIVRLQEAFGPRIERILGASGGLLVIMSSVDASAEQVAIDLSESIPVALIEPQTFSGLKRLGAASPVAGMPLLLDRPSDAEQESAYARLAKAKLSSAELLIEQGQLAGVADLLAAAMIAGVADRAGWTVLPNADDVSLWVYADALPNHLLPPEQGAALVRAISLAKVASIPDELVFEILADAREIVA